MGTMLMISPKLNDLLELEPEQLLDWVIAAEKELWDMRIFNWLGMAEIVAFHAREFNDLVRAEIAVRIYDRLSQTEPSTLEGFSGSAMSLRVYMISKSGAKPDDIVLDVERIVQWFYESTRNLTIDQAIEKSNNWREMWKASRIEEVRELRRIKNRLHIIEKLIEGGHLIANDNIAAWLRIRPQLP